MNFSDFKETAISLFKQIELMGPLVALNPESRAKFFPIYSDLLEKQKQLWGSDIDALFLHRSLKEIYRLPKFND